MLKGILLRIIIYSLCAYIFHISWKMTFEPTRYENAIYSTKALFYSPFGLIASLVYPITDIIILVRDLLKSKNNNDNPK
ncbi:hypothetical protein [uncultured Winogradskyella sp.]|uniref:hypothetical protein n=1 Tax=uncultured Winogradskyella sp. TaxID=395353 RepID=UPI0030D702BB